MHVLEPKLINKQSKARNILQMMWRTLLSDVKPLQRYVTITGMAPEKLFAE
jgi:hypothetical protein